MPARGRVSLLTRRKAEPWQPAPARPEPERPRRERAGRARAHRSARASPCPALPNPKPPRAGGAVERRKSTTAGVATSLRPTGERGAVPDRRATPVGWRATGLTRPRSGVGRTSTRWWRTLGPSVGVEASFVVRCYGGSREVSSIRRRAGHGPAGGGLAHEEASGIPTPGPSILRTVTGSRGLAPLTPDRSLLDREGSAVGFAFQGASFRSKLCGATRQRRLTSFGEET